MSALRIGKRGSAPAVTPCAGGCKITSGGYKLGIKLATRRVLIAGYPIGGLCERCAKSWRKCWDEALEDEKVAA